MKKIALFIALLFATLANAQTYEGTIQLKRKTLAQAAASTEVLKVGQVCVIINADPSDEGHARFYIGDGAKTLSQLVSDGYFNCSWADVLAQLDEYSPIDAQGNTFFFETSTSSSPQVGPGKFRLNHESPYSITNLYLCKDNAATYDMEDYVRDLQGGYLLLQSTETSAIMMFSYSTITELSGSFNIAVDFIAGSNLFAANERIAFWFDEKGSDGVSTFAALTGAPEDNAALADALEEKADDAVVVGTEGMLVSGAGTAAANGAYTRNDAASGGSFEGDVLPGTARYAKGDIVIIKIDASPTDRWIINDNASDIALYRGAAASDYASPSDELSWLVTDGDSPAPTLDASAADTLTVQEAFDAVVDSLDLKLAKSKNLSDVASASTAFANIKQAATTSATGVVELATDGETAAGVAVQGNDNRLALASTALQNIPSLDQVLNAGAQTLGNSVIFSPNDLAAMTADDGSGGTALQGPATAGATFIVRLPAEDGTLLTNNSPAGSFPTLNQNTTGSAAKWTTARNLAGNSVDGSANVAFANKVILQGTSDAGFTNAQFLGALGTGLVKNTTTTGVLSIAAAGTDYAPATSGNGLLKGNGSGGFSTATAGTDYLAPTTVTATYSSGSQASTTTSLATVPTTTLALTAGTWDVYYKVTYDAALGSTGAKFSIGAATASASMIFGKAFYDISINGGAVNYFDAFDGGVVSSTSRTATGNMGGVEATIVVTGAGNINLRFASEVAGSAITIQSVTMIAVRKA